MYPFSRDLTIPHSSSAHSMKMAAQHQSKEFLSFFLDIMPYALIIMIIYDLSGGTRTPIFGSSTWSYKNLSVQHKSVGQLINLWNDKQNLGTPALYRSLL